MIPRQCRNLADMKSDGTRLTSLPLSQFATLTFVFVCDEAESELGVLDLIQVFVEALDRMFENVCELDLVFGFDEVSLEREQRALSKRANPMACLFSLFSACRSTIHWLRSSRVVLSSRPTSTRYRTMVRYRRPPLHPLRPVIRLTRL